jgi:oxygen-dependent protoporphyrinogen oxidase
MKRIAIIGGGVSGLAAAYALEKAKGSGTPLESVLFESSNQLGGVIRTERIEDCVVEGGPDSFLTEKPWAAELCRDLGLGDALIGSNDGERKTYMLVRGKLVPIPDGLMFMVPTKLAPAFFSPLFSWTTKLRIVREWLSPPRPKTGEMTVAQFVERHYGREMVERVADPLLAGVYGGSSEQLSIDAVLPRFVQMEAKYGSLGRAMVAGRKHVTSREQPSLFTSLKGGMQQMTDSLVKRLAQNSLRLNSATEVVRPESGKWLLFSRGRTEEFDAVVVAIPAHAAAPLLAGCDPELAKDLQAVPYVSSITVVLGYQQSVRTALPAGFGFLIPRTEGRKILAATFVHNKFSHRAPDDRALVRCFLGGSGGAEALSLPDTEIAEIVHRQLEQILVIRSAPLFARVYKWPKAMAQYGIGHNEGVSRIKARLAGVPGLALAGNAYAGIGVPDCVRSGREAVSKVLADLGLPS